MDIRESTSAGLGLRQRQILFRSRHRGLREMDILLGEFAAALVGELPANEIADFELLLDVPDRDALGWLTGEIPIPPEFETPLMRRLRNFLAART